MKLELNCDTIGDKEKEGLVSFFLIENSFYLNLKGKHLVWMENGLKNTKFESIRIQGENKRVIGGNK